MGQWLGVGGVGPPWDRQEDGRRLQLVTKARASAQVQAVMCRCLYPLPLLLLLAVQPLPVPAVMSVTDLPPPHNRSTAPGARANATSTSHGPSIATVLAMLRHYPALEGLVLASCAGALLLLFYLMVKVLRSRRKYGKTRKYDIITTPAEKVEMKPLNEEDDDDEDATVFDVKYSR
ncbi:membrane protein FAM174B [Rhinoraja longicauda]